MTSLRPKKWKCRSRVDGSVSQPTKGPSGMVAHVGVLALEISSIFRPFIFVAARFCGYQRVYLDSLISHPPGAPPPKSPVRTHTHTHI